VYELAVEETISAGHMLRGYHGQCERCHGHNWRIRLEVSTPDLDATGLAMDFTALQTLLREVLAEFDHVMLNELPEFAQLNPSAENLARVIHERCAVSLRELPHPPRLDAVVVWESSSTSVRYRA
jgi:6-pyruvoyltetrahydropterin/6-carboxytetrahydropterin synthase